MSKETVPYIMLLGDCHIEVPKDQLGKCVSPQMGDLDQKKTHISVKNGYFLFAFEFYVLLKLPLIVDVDCIFYVYGLCI